MDRAKLQKTAKKIGIVLGITGFGIGALWLFAFVQEMLFSLLFIGAGTIAALFFGRRFKRRLAARREARRVEKLLRDAAQSSEKKG